MKKQLSESDTIDRIIKMERCYDEICNAVYGGDTLIYDESFNEKLKTLIDYYDSGQWLKDYECDERGELPNDLKRGVLSQDGVYNLISELMNFENFSDEEC